VETSIFKYLFGVNVVNAMQKLQPNVHFIHTLESDLFNFIQENVCFHLYVDAKIYNNLLSNVSETAVH